MATLELSEAIIVQKAWLYPEKNQSQDSLEKKFEDLKSALLEQKIQVNRIEVVRWPIECEFKFSFNERLSAVAIIRNVAEELKLRIEGPKAKKT